MNTGAAGGSPVPGSEMPMSACFDLARSVDDAAHHRDVEALDARIARLPFRHRVADEALDAGARAPGMSSRWCGRSRGRRRPAARRCASPSVCNNSCATFTSSVRSPFGSGVSEMRMVSPMPCCSRTPMRRRRSDDALRAHAGLGEAEMQRIVGAPRQLAIDRDQVLHGRDFGRK